MTDRIYQHEHKAVSEKTTAIEKLEAYIHSVFIDPEKNKKFYKVYLDFIAQASRNPQYRQINLKFYENCWKIGRDIVALGQKEGTFSADIQADTASKMIRSIIDGCLIQWLMCDEDHLHEFYKNTCYDVILKYLK